MSELSRITDRYRLDKLVHASDAASVFRAVDLRQRRVVALKLMRSAPQIAAPSTAEDRARFDSACEALRECNHPSLPRLLDFGVTGTGETFLATDYLLGATFDLLAGSPAARVLPLLLPVLDALEELDRHGLSHRNLTAENLLVVPRGGEEEEVKLLGWGSATADASDAGRRADLRAFAELTCAAIEARIDRGPSLVVNLRPEDETQVADASELAILLSLLLQPGGAMPSSLASQLRLAFRHALSGNASTPSRPAPPAAPGGRDRDRDLPPGHSLGAPAPALDLDQALRADVTMAVPREALFPGATSPTAPRLSAGPRTDTLPTFRPADLSSTRPGLTLAPSGAPPADPPGASGETAGAAGSWPGEAGGEVDAGAAWPGATEDAATAAGGRLGSAEILAAKGGNGPIQFAAALAAEPWLHDREDAAAEAGFRAALTGAASAADPLPADEVDEPLPSTALQDDPDGEPAATASRMRPATAARPSAGTTAPVPVPVTATATMAPANTAAVPAASGSGEPAGGATETWAATLILRDPFASDPAPPVPADRNGAAAGTATVPDPYIVPGAALHDDGEAAAGGADNDDDPAAATERRETASVLPFPSLAARGGHASAPGKPAGADARFQPDGNALWPDHLQDPLAPTAGVDLPAAAELRQPITGAPFGDGASALGGALGWPPGEIAGPADGANSSGPAAAAIASGAAGAAIASGATGAAIASGPVGAPMASVAAGATAASGATVGAPAGAAATGAARPRRPWLAGVAVALAALVVIGLAALAIPILRRAAAGRGTPAPVVTAPRPATPAPVAAPLAPPGPPAPAAPPTPALDPRLTHADELLASGDIAGARKELAHLSAADQAALGAADREAYDRLTATVASGVRAAIAGDLAAGLRRGDLRRLNAALAAAKRETGLPAGMRRDLDRARQAVDLDTQLQRPDPPEAPADALRDATALLALVPRYSRAAEQREAAAKALEQQADAATAAGDADRAAKVLAALRQAWPDRAGLADRTEQVETLRRGDQRAETALAAAERAEAANQPLQGIEALAAAAPTSRFRDRFRQERERLNQLLAKLDANPPTLALRPGFKPEYEKGAAIAIPLRITDDFAVKTTECWVRAEGETAYRSLPVRHLAGADYEVDISPDLHQNRVLELYLVATDPSGHQGTLGSRDKPLKLKHRNWIEKIFTGGKQPN